MPFTALLMGAKLAMPGSAPRRGEPARPLSTRAGHGDRRACRRSGSASSRRSSASPGAGSSRRGCAWSSAARRAPKSLIRGLDRYGMRVVHGWGMTETSPVGRAQFHQARDRRTPATTRRTRCARSRACRCRSSRCARSPTAAKSPWDGETMGELEVRGPWVRGALPRPAGSRRSNGPRTAGSAPATSSTIDAAATSRSPTASRTSIKSGGEWISSIDLENALVAHPGGAGSGGDRGRRIRSGASARSAVVVLKAGDDGRRRKRCARTSPGVREVCVPGRVRLRGGDSAHVDGEDDEG